MIKIVRFNLSLMLGFVLTAATASAAATLGPFRAPAIPLFTTDPYMQTWMMGDNTTAVSGNVKKEERKKKSMRQRHLCHSLKILLHRWPQVTELPRETLCRPCHITVSTRAHTRIYIFIPSLFFFFSPKSLLVLRMFYVHSVSAVLPSAGAPRQQPPTNAAPPSVSLFPKISLS